ncbi:MAG: hypothetical protein AAFV37_11095 [Pseudomonadota bacterium]
MAPGCDKIRYWLDVPKGAYLGRRKAIKVFVPQKRHELIFIISERYGNTFVDPSAINDAAIWKI